MAVPNTFNEVIDRAGGKARLAEACGVEPARVAKWIQRGVIPPEFWIQVAELARGVSVKRLAELYSVYRLGKASARRSRQRDKGKARVAAFQSQKAKAGEALS